MVTPATASTTPGAIGLTAVLAPAPDLRHPQPDSRDGAGGRHRPDLPLSLYRAKPRVSAGNVGVWRRCYDSVRRLASRPGPVWRLSRWWLQVNTGALTSTPAPRRKFHDPGGGTSVAGNAAAHHAAIGDIGAGARGSATAQPRDGQSRSRAGRRHRTVLAPELEQAPIDRYRRAATA